MAKAEAKTKVIVAEVLGEGTKKRVGGELASWVLKKGRTSLGRCK